MRTLAPALLAVLLVPLLAPGCLGPGPDRFGPHDETRLASDSERFPGLSLRGTLQGEGEALRIVAVARNDGPNTYDVETGCTTPWTEVLFRGEEQLEHRRPVATCAMFGTQPFTPGMNLTYEIAWTGLLYDAEEEEFHPASAGNYTWSVRLTAYAQDTLAVRRLDLDFNVVVA